MTAPSNVAVGDQITAADRNNLIAWVGGSAQTYTPALTATTTNPTLGSGATQAGAYVQVGNHVTGWVQIAFGSSGAAAGSGSFLISAPVSIGASVNGNMVLGIGHIQCAGLWTSVVVRKQNSTTLNLVYLSAAVNGSRTVVSATQPGAWTNSDQLLVNFSYPTA